ncbi:MAG: SH3 domain-containing protein [Gallionella sp.]|nr:SH3 domain-containing protein [Gallionella sp.]
MTLRFNHLLLAAMMLIATAAQAGESGTTVKADTLKAAPFSDAKVIATLPSGAKVEILKKDGGWYQVKSPQGNGWIRLLSIRRGGAKATSAGSELSGLSGLASGRSGTGRVVATTGIRGLNEEQLKAAKYDEKQVTLAESYLTSRADAKKFAASAKLAARQLDYLPDPSTGESK